MTGCFPAQHGVKYTLEEDMPADQYPQVEMPLDLENVASVMSAADYSGVHKGKWHLCKPLGTTCSPVDLARYGFHHWDLPNARANQDDAYLRHGRPRRAARKPEELDPRNPGYGSCHKSGPTETVA